MEYGKFINAYELITRNIGDGETIGQKKLFKLHNKLKPIYEEWVEKRDDIRLDHASVDDKNNIIINDKGDYVFTKDNLRLLNNKLRDLMKKELDFKKINVVNPKGLEEFLFLQDIVDGVKFEISEDEEL